MQLGELFEDLKVTNCKSNMRRLFQMTKSITQKYQPRLHCIQSASGEKVTDAVGIAERWREYCEERYSGGHKQETDHQCDREPPPLRSEVVRAIWETANGKRTGPDDFSVELFKTESDTTLDRKHRMCMAAWQTGEWPDDGADSILITLA